MKSTKVATSVGTGEQTKLRPGFENVSLATLRQMRNGLKKEEDNVSYWRRILEARVDLMRKGADAKRVSIPQLTNVLTEARNSHRRVTAMSVEPMDNVPPLPNIAELWARPVPLDGPERHELLEALCGAEHDLCQYRFELHRRIDVATAELIDRYRDNPDLALTALRESLPFPDDH